MDPSPTRRDTSSLRQGAGGWLFPLITAAVIAVWLVPECFSSQPFHSWDLHGHVALTRRLAAMLLRGHLLFFDPWWFSGWPAFTFYPPLGHLLAALLSYPLSLLSTDPARLSCHLLLGLGIAGMPLSMFAMARVIFFADRTPSPTAGAHTLLGISSSLLALWFLLHSEYYYGLGSAAGTHLGLFSQVLGWHGLLFFSATLLRCLDAEESGGQPPLARMCLASTLLLLVHTLTFVFAGTFAFFLLLVRRAPVRQWLAMLSGIGVSAFWLLPAVLFSRELAPLDQLPAQGDFLSLLFRYSPQGALRNIALGQGGPAVMTLFFFGLFAAILHPRVRERTFLLSALFCCVLAESILVSDFFAANFPLGLHLYRFLGLSLLLFVGSLAVIPAALPRHARGAVVASCILLACGALHSASRTVPTDIPANGLGFDDEQAVLEAFGPPPGTVDVPKNRVLFELLAADAYPNYPSPHFLPSELEHLSGRETLNGLFIQSSLTQAFILNTAVQLKLNFYGSPELTSSDEHFTPEDFLAQLHDFGVTTVVSTKPPEKSPIAPLVGADRVKRFGKLFVYDIGKAEEPVRSTGKHVVVYVDRENTLPFKIVEYVFYSHKALWENSELIHLSPGEEIPPEADLIVINDGDEDDFAATLAGFAQTAKTPLPAAKRIRFPELEPKAGMSARERLEHHINSARRYLIGQLDLPGQVSALPTAGTAPAADPTVTFDWKSQRIELANLRPGKLVRLNYSFSPFWISPDASVLRGMGERIWVLPKKDHVVLSYHPGRSLPALLGAGMTIVTLISGLALRSNRSGLGSR